MIVRLSLFCPKGMAKDVGWKARMLIVRFSRVKVKEWISPEADCVCWEIECNARQWKSIMYNASQWTVIAKTVAGDKRLMKLLDSDADRAALLDLLQNQTRVEVVKLDKEDVTDIPKEGWFKKIFSRLGR